MIPEYFNEELAKVVERINHYKQPDSFMFSLFADVHTHENQYDHGAVMEHTLETVGEVHKRCNVDGLIFLGDIPLVDGSERFSPKLWTMEKIDEALDTLYNGMKKANPNSFLVPGNHDGEYAAPINQKHFYSRYIENNKPQCKISKVQDKAYYYADYPEQKVRLVCLACISKDDEGNTILYSQDQLKWLCDEALSVLSDTNIFFFTHFPPVCGDYPVEWSDGLRGVLDAYKNRQKCSIDGIEYDFSKAKGKIRAMFVGDGHYDWIDKEGFICPVVEVAMSVVHEIRFKNNGWWMPENASSPKRTYGTPSELAWDTVIFNPSDNDMVLVRFGAGADRYCTL